MRHNSFTEIVDKYCKPKQVHGSPIKLMTTEDRWVLGQRSIAGHHDGGMAMWSQPFDGGKILAEYIFGHKEEFRGKTIVDIGSGSGLVAIAAAMAGSKVTAIDSSPYTEHIIPINAEMNGVTLDVIRENAVIREFLPYAKADIVTAADVFYAHSDMDGIVETLSILARDHKTIYATSQDEELPALLTPFGVTPKLISDRFISFVTFDASDCGSPIVPLQKHRSGFHL